jgi:hypothetical protein
LAKASFEETERILLKAAVFGEIDPITGVSANIMTGQPIRGGTSFTGILLDEEAMLRYMNEVPEDKRFDPPEQDPLKTDGEIDQVLYKKESGYCAADNLKFDTTLPHRNEEQSAEEMPDINVVELVDE